MIAEIVYTETYKFTLTALINNVEGGYGTQLMYLDVLRKIEFDNLPVLVFQITKVKKIDLEVTATVDDNDDADQNAEKTASLEIDPENENYFVINGILLSIVKNKI